MFSLQLTEDIITKRSYLVFIFQFEVWLWRTRLTPSDSPSHITSDCGREWTARGALQAPDSQGVSDTNGGSDVPPKSLQKQPPVHLH